MNARHHGWILCPSKSFPGKFYYFNVINGEAAWSLDDAESQIFERSDCIQREPLNHQHPEPSSPPIPEPIRHQVPSPFTSMNQTPVYGQPVVWTPIQIPLILPNEANYNNTGNTKQDYPKHSEIESQFTRRECKDASVQAFTGQENSYLNTSKSQVTRRECKDASVQAFTGQENSYLNISKSQVTRRECKDASVQAFTGQENSYLNISKSQVTRRECKDASVQAFTGQENSYLNISKSQVTRRECKDASVQAFTGQENSYLNISKSQVTRRECKDASVQAFTGQENSYLNTSEFYTSTIKQSNLFPRFQAEAIKSQATRRECKDASVQAFTGQENSYLSTPEFYTSTLKQSNLSPRFQAKASLSYADLSSKFENKHPIFNLGLPSLPKEIETVQEYRPNLLEDKIESPVSRSLELSDSDLRKTLLIKRRWSDTTNADFESTATKQPRQTHLLPKKRVRFNLDNVYEGLEDDEDINLEKERHRSTLKHLKDLADPEKTTEDHKWYIVTDAEVLMKEYRFIEQFVQIDATCKLLVPASVFAELSAEARGSGDRASVNAARNAVRRIHDVYVQSTYETNIKLSTKDDIMNCCMETITDNNIHLVLITNDPELHATARQYQIHCYSLNSIKTGLAQPQYQQMKITIKNPTDSHIQTDSAKLENKEFDNNVLTEKEKEIIRNFNRIDNDPWTSNINSWDPNINSRDPNINARNPNETSTTPNINFNSAKPNETKNDSSVVPKYTRNPNENSTAKAKIYSNESLRIANAIPISPRDTRTNTYNTNAKETHQMNISSTANKSDRNISTAPYKTMFEFSNSVFNQETSNQERIYASDIEETVDIENLNLTDTVSVFFQKPTFDVFNIKHLNTYETPKSNMAPTYETPKSNMAPTFETQKSNVASSVCKSNMASYVIKPSKILLNINKIDLSEFVVKNKDMDNRLRDRIEDYVCSYKQIMEEALSSVLEKLSHSVLKSMRPPWSLHEALQCTKKVYKEHTAVIKIVDTLCTYMYDRNDKLKNHMTPEDFMKGLGCGIRLLEYLKKILLPSIGIQDGETSLQALLKQIEDEYDYQMDPNDPLVKAPVMAHPDDLIPRQNFVKHKSEIRNYLIKHFSEWKEYKEDKLSVVRTLGKVPVTLERRDDSRSKTDANALGRNVEEINEENCSKIGKVKVRSDLKHAKSDFGNHNCDKNTNDGNFVKNANNEAKPGTSNNVCEKEPKIVRSANLMTEYENRLRNRKLNQQADKTTNVQTKQDNKSNSDTKSTNIDTETNDKQKDTAKTQDKYPKTCRRHELIRNANRMKDYEGKLQKKAKTGTAHDNDNNDKPRRQPTETLSNDNSAVKHDNETLNNDSNATKEAIHINTQTEPAGHNVTTDYHVDNDEDCYNKDVMTNDNGLGKESPRFYSVVETFLIEFEESLEYIQKYIDGCIEEFESGKMEAFKATFRLKAFEIQHLITNLMLMMKRILKDPPATDNAEERARNAAAVSKFLVKGTVLYKLTHAILSVTKDKPVSSSMNTNATS